MNILLFKKTKDSDLKQGLPVCYKDINGAFTKLGVITDIYQQDGINLYSINTSMGAYVASELKLIAPGLHTQGKWELQALETSKNGYPNWNTFCIRSNKNCHIATIGDVDRFHEEEAEANAKLMAAAPELLQMVFNLKNCINRLSQDNLTQDERDAEAQWEGEAHELLSRINPNYYPNANEVFN